MPENFTRKTYNNWMLNNRYRFQHKPYIVKVVKTILS